MGTPASRPTPAGDTDPSDHPLFQLERDDLNLITAFVLESGSLKALATAYGVSYPTIRNRLDQTISRLRDRVDGAAPDPLRDALARLVDQGRLTAAEAESLDKLAREAPSRANARKKGAKR